MADSEKTVSHRKSIYKSSQQRDIAPMYDEKMPWHEITTEMIKLLESLPDKERKMSLGATAGHFDFAVVSNKPAPSANTFKRYPKRS